MGSLQIKAIFSLPVSEESLAGIFSYVPKEQKNESYKKILENVESWVNSKENLMLYHSLAVLENKEGEDQYILFGKNGISDRLIGNFEDSEYGLLSCQTPMGDIIKRSVRVVSKSKQVGMSQYNPFEPLYLLESLQDVCFRGRQTAQELLSDAQFHDTSFYCIRLTARRWTGVPSPVENNLFLLVEESRRVSAAPTPAPQTQENRS